MISYANAQEILLSLAKDIKIAQEEIKLLDSVNRICAEDIFSPEEIPASDNSAMDGYAVRSSDIASASPGNPIIFNVIDALPAGKSSLKLKINAAETIEIMTGAVLPIIGADTIVRKEDAKREGNQILITAPVAKDSDIRHKGTDFKIGQLVLNKGQKINESHTMALACLGISKLKVYKKIEALIISTGNEIVEHETKELLSFQTRNSSMVFLNHFFKNNNINSTYAGILKDNESDSLALIDNICKEKHFDLIISTGGVSVGKWDFVTTYTKRLGFKEIFHKVAVRPGKPIFCAQNSSGTLFWGLPGNPISTAIGAYFFLRPLIYKVLDVQWKNTGEFATLQTQITKPKMMDCFYKGYTSTNEDAQVIVHILDGQSSYMIHSFLKTNCWVHLPVESDKFDVGQKVKIFRL